MRKGVFGVIANIKDPDRSAAINIYGLIRNFAILHYVLQYSMIL